ncbi:RTA1 like protein-domain-containing protein [Daldinia eschscholtzii]|nr:RTA1 like protein-domain-containing protein [Daldinia eschscholtzii]
MASSTDCVSSRCSRVFLTYKPSLAGNGVFLALFAILIPVAFALGIKYKSTVFSTAVVTGLALEVVGYIGRLLLYNTPTDRSGFILFLIGTIVGPTLICGSLFLIIPQVITVYGEEFRSWRSPWYCFLLQVLTALSLALELAGGLVSAIKDDQEQVDVGNHVLFAGLVIQLITLLITIGHAILFTVAVQTRHHILDVEFAGIYNSGSFKAFLFAFAFAILLLVLRTAYRTVAVAEGYASSIAQSETLLLVLDGLMVLLATLILLAFFPGRILRDSVNQMLPHRSPRTPLQPIRVAPYDLPSTQSSPTYNQARVKPPMLSHHVRKSEPLPQRNMVDSDSLW